MDARERAIEELEKANQALNNDLREIRITVQKLRDREISDSQRQSIISFVNEYGCIMFDVAREENTDEQDKLIKRATDKKGFIKVMLGFIK